VLRLSTNDFVAELFDADKEDKKTARQMKGKGDAKAAKANLKKSMKKAAKAAGKTNKTTVGAAFKLSLAKLMTEMNSASPHFIRCLKPNMHKSPKEFDVDLVTKQLRYTGMLETTRIRREGYSYRPTFEDFLKRYKVLGFPFSSNPPATLSTCQTILDAAGVKGWMVGKTKVFLRYFHSDELNQKFAPFPNAAKVVQKVARGFHARYEVRKILEQKKKTMDAVDRFVKKAEQLNAGMRYVMEQLCDEDRKRPADFWTKPPPKVVVDKKKKAVEQKNRKQSVRWFKEVEMKKGVGINEDGEGGFQVWFHGIITRQQSERLLAGTLPGTFLVRVAESRFGYSLSHK